jgi:outer membrane murein-binding lipoprotein Lpp
MNIKLTMACAALALFLLVGCLSSVKVDKRPNVALPIYDSSSNIVEYA